MRTNFVALATAILTSLTLSTAQAAEPKHGGILKIYHRETPPSLSIHEEATFSVNIPAMGLFNNLVIYDQHKPQNSMSTIVPELATSWAWSADNLKLTFKLREGVKWHDGQPFTAKDVKCTFDLIQGKGQDKFRKNPRKDLFSNISDVTTNGDFEVTLQLKRPQPSLVAMIASGYTPIYSCHVPTAQMRTHPIGTGPFKFVEFKQNESITLAKNQDYWKKGLPYLDGIEFTIIRNRATAVLAFVAGNVDMTFPTEMTAALHQGHQGAGRHRRSARSRRSTSAPISSSTARTRPSTISNCARRWRWRSTARPSSTSSCRGRATPAVRCCRRRKAFGACRPTCSRPFPAMAT